MKFRFLALAALLAFGASGAAQYPNCTGSDCTPTCTSQPACAPAGPPCPQAGPPWC